MSATHVTFYASQDVTGSRVLSTWSVYQEEYVSPDSAEPIDGSQRWLSRWLSEAEADAEVARLYASRQVASSVRDAVLAAIGVSDGLVHGPFEAWGQLIDEIVRRVEEVPVKVTIRDLPMEPENVITLSGESVGYLHWATGEARRLSVPLHLAVDEGDLKVKIANASWSRPLPTEEYAG